MVLKKKILVAVYGSLRQGLGNYKHYLKDEKRVGQFETEPEFTLLDLGAFPGLLKSGNTSVVMEVFEIDAEKLRQLDRLEGFNGVGKRNMYDRVRIETPFGQAFTYIYNNEYPDNIPEVDSGDWVDHLKTKTIRSL